MKWAFKHHIYVKADNLSYYVYIIDYIHLYSWCLDIIRNVLFCRCCLSFQLDADFFSFYNPVAPPPTSSPHPRCPLDMLHIFVIKNRWPKGVLGLRGNILKIKFNYTIFSVRRTNLTFGCICIAHAQWLVFKILNLHLYALHCSINVLRKWPWPLLVS